MRSFLLLLVILQAAACGASLTDFVMTKLKVDTASGWDDPVVLLQNTKNTSVLCLKNGIIEALLAVLFIPC